MFSSNKSENFNIFLEIYMSDLNSIGSPQDLPVDGHGYVPTKRESKGEKDQREDADLKHEDRVQEVSLVVKIRDLSNSINLLQDKLLNLTDPSEERDDVVYQIQQSQVSIENLCSVSTPSIDPQESLGQITNLINKQGFKPSTLAVKRLLGDE
jgi:hypothetical protein